MARANDGKKRSNERRAKLQLNKRVTPEELADFKERADAAGYSDHRAYLTAFITGKIKPDLAARKFAVLGLGHIGKVGSNLNQIARAANAGHLTGLKSKDRKNIAEARASVQQVGAEIRQALRR